MTQATFAMPSVRNSMILFVFALCALATWICLEERAISHMEGILAPLRAKQIRSSQLRDDNRRLAIRASELAAARRAQAGQIHTLIEENSGTAEFRPASDWRNAGNATPGSAFETYVWAIDHGDAAALVSVLEFTDASKAKLDAIFADLPEDARGKYGSPEKMFALLYANSNPVLFDAMRVLDDKAKSDYPDHFVALPTEWQYSEGQVRAHPFYLFHYKDGWKKGLADGEVAYVLASQLGVSSEN